MELTGYKDKVIGVYGLGASGLSAVQAFQQAGAHVFFYDDHKLLRAKAAANGLVCTHPKDWPWRELLMLVPGHAEHVAFPITHPVLRKAMKEAIPVHSDVDIFAMELAKRSAEPAGNGQPRIVGVTGCNGKTLTVELLSHIITETGCSVRAVTDKSVQLLDAPMPRDDEIVVLELRPAKLRFTSQLKCNIGIVLNANYLDRGQFTDSAELMKVCARVFRNQSNQDLSIIGVDDAVSQKMCTALIARNSRTPEATSRIVPVSGEATLGEGIFSLDGRAFEARNGKTIAISEFDRVSAIIGTHYNQDVAAAIAASLALEVTSAQITRAIHSFSGVSGRMECLGDHGQITLFDDGASRNMFSTAKALSCGQNIFWIGGGTDVKADYTRLTHRPYSVTKAFLFGGAAAPIRTAIGTHFETDCFATQEDAIKQALREASALSVSDPSAAPMVLYSPGCPVREKGGRKMFRQLTRRFLEGKAA